MAGALKKQKTKEIAKANSQKVHPAAIGTARKKRQSQFIDAADAAEAQNYDDDFFEMEPGGSDSDSDLGAELLEHEDEADFEVPEESKISRTLTD